jgi:hypothetical protein
MLNVPALQRSTGARRAVLEPCETGGRRDRAHVSSQEAVPWVSGGEVSHRGDSSEDATDHGSSRNA